MAYQNTGCGSRPIKVFYIDSIGTFECLKMLLIPKKCFLVKQIWLGFDKQLKYSKYTKYGGSGINHLILYAIHTFIEVATLLV